MDVGALGAERTGWIGHRPTILQMTCFLIEGSIGLIIAGVQPVVLGAMVSEHRLSAAELGWATTLEFVALGIGVSLAGMFFPPTRLRRRVVLAAIVIIAADLLIRRQSGFVVLGDRVVAGLAEGVLTWSTTLMILRSGTPARWAAIYLVSQGVAQLVFAAVVPGAFIEPFGADGGFFALALTGVVGCLAAFGLPNNMQPLPKPPDAARRDGLPKAALVSLLGVALTYAFFIGLFAYLTEFGAQAHLSDEETGFAVALAVGISVVGSGVAGLLANRLSHFAAFLICFPMFTLSVATFALLPGMAIFLAASGVFGFFWGLLMPFQIPFVMSADPTRRAVLLVPGTQAAGASLGPLLCSFAVSDNETRGALLVCSICLAVSFAIALGLKFHRPATLSVGATNTI
jgi:MFS family permease